MRESRSYGTVGGVVRLRAGRPYPGIRPHPKIGFLAETKSNSVRGAGISPQIVHAGERFFPRGKRSIVLTRVFL